MQRPCNELLLTGLVAIFLPTVEIVESLCKIEGKNLVNALKMNRRAREISHDDQIGEESSFHYQWSTEHIVPRFGGARTRNQTVGN